ncbi:MAG: PilZ domain-containing protein [Xanthobacteraceae bacterium]
MSQAIQSLTPDEERRGSKRCHLYHTVKMQFATDRRQRECIILDISDEGVRVYAVGFDVPDEFVLLFSDVVRETYKVIWRRAREVGAKFVGRESAQNQCDLTAVA